MSKKLDDLPPKIRKKISVHGRVEDGNCWMWTGGCSAPRFTPAYAKPGTVHRIQGERAASYKRRLPQVWSREHGYPVPAHRLIYCITEGIPYEDMPEIRRCERNDTCVNPDHLTLKGKHRIRPQGDLTKIITSRLPETRAAIWERLTTVQPMPGMSPQSTADECGLTEVSLELLQEYEAWYKANPHLIRNDEEDEDDDD